MNSMAGILIVRISFPQGLATPMLVKFIIHVLLLDPFLDLLLFLVQITSSSVSTMKENICGGTHTNDFDEHLSSAS
jgi:hypothetical protein